MAQNDKIVDFDENISQPFQTVVSIKMKKKKQPKVSKSF